MPAPVGATVTISPFDMRSGEPVPEEGVYLLSAGGTAYLIVASRLMTRSARPNNYALRCPTRYGAVVKLQGGTGSVGSTPAPYTTTPARDIVMPYKRSEESRAAARAYSREYGRTHREEKQAYRLAHPQIFRDASCATDANRRAKQHGAPGRITSEDVREVREIGVCFYCGATDEIGIDHAIPLYRQGPNTRENLVPCCGPCNRRKARGESPARWSELYDACQECGLTDRPHKGRGYCGRCHYRLVRSVTLHGRQVPPSAWRKG